MGFARERVGAGRNGALHRDVPGPQGTAAVGWHLPPAAEADRAWQRAEARVAQGYLGDPGRGRQSFRDYVEKTWLPNHEIEASTRQSYTYVLEAGSCRSSARCG